MVDEDRTVVVGFREAVGLWRQLVVIFQRLGNAQRVEVGMQMTAHAIGADHHDGTDGITGRLEGFFGRELRAGLGCLFLDLAVEMLFDCAPVAIKR